MVGLLASALFISVFTESMLNQVDVLRSGKSRVVETGHVLVSFCFLLFALFSFSFLLILFHLESVVVPGCRARLEQPVGTQPLRSSKSVPNEGVTPGHVMFFETHLKDKHAVGFLSLWGGWLKRAPSLLTCQDFKFLGSLKIRNLRPVPFGSAWL